MRVFATFTLFALTLSTNLLAQNIQVTSAPELIWDRSVHKCDETDTVDTVFRPYKVGNVPLDLRGTNPNYNKVVAFATHHNHNYPMVGDSLDSLQRVCSNPSLTSDLNPEYSTHRNYEWLASNWASGRLVTAITHNEYQGHRYNSQCNSYSSCWWNSLTISHSFYNGRSFNKDLLEQERVLAAVPGPHIPNTGPRGFFHPSNIVFDRTRNAFFMLVQVEARKDGQADYIQTGTCVLRASPRRRYGLIFPDFEWRAWDGQGFNADIANGESCKSVTNLSKMNSSLSFNTTLNKWLLVDTIGGATHSNFGVYYSTSEDLLEWTNPTLLMSAAHPAHNGIAYISLIDPDSPGQNYVYSDDQAYLYYTKFNNGHGGLDRDLMRVEISINN